MAAILVVEDNLTLASGLQFTLEQEGWEVELALSRVAAEQALAARPFDLLLLDQHLPDGTGFELCKRVRARSAVPILFLTAADEEFQVVRVLEMGADDHITKPFPVRELVARVRAALRRRAEPDGVGGVLVSGRFAFNLTAHTVTRDGRPLALTPIEYKLLLVLARHPGAILTGEQMLSILWDIDGAFVDDHTLSVHIRRLREKVEADPSRPACILTVWGGGYRWTGGVQA